MSKYMELELDKLVVSPVKMRELKEDSEDFAGLCRSVAMHGVMQPIIAVPLFDKTKNIPVPGMFNLWDGLHRFHAAKAAGLTTIPAKVWDEKDVTEEDEYTVQYILNRHRVKSTKRDELEHIKKFMFRHQGYSRKDVAEKFSMTYNELNRILSFDNLSEEAAMLVDSGKIKASPGYALSTLPTENQNQIKLGEEEYYPIKLAMEMPADEFISWCKNLKDQIAKAKRSGKKDIGPIINPMPLSKTELLSLWSQTQHELETTDVEDDSYKVIQGRHEMIEIVLQVDPAAQARKAELKAQRKKDASIERAKKRKEAADKAYESAMKAMNKAAEDKLAESLA